MSDYKLFMLLLGCRPAGRNTEQHDVFFGIAKELKNLIPDIKKFWKGAGSIHIDGWKTVTHIDGFTISVSEEKNNKKSTEENLFFLNLGGYKHNIFEEFHYKMLTIAASKADAIKIAKQTAFYLHTESNFNTSTHIDDKYGVDVDDLYEIKEILPAWVKEKFTILIQKNNIENISPDEIHLGYFPLNSL